MYYCITWLIVGMLLSFAAFFTYANNYQSVSFSIDNNDVYEVRHDLLKYRLIETNHYKKVLQLDLTHIDEHYLRIKIKGVTNADARMLVSAGNIDGDDVYLKTDAFVEDPLTDGVKDYELTSNDFEYVVIDIFGEEGDVLKSVQFRESIEPIPIKGALLIVGITIAVYVIITGIILALVRKRKNETVYDGDYTGQRFSKEALEHKDTGEGFSFMLPPAFAACVRTMLFFSMMASSLLLEMHVNGYAYKENFHQYIHLQLAIVIFLTMFMLDESHPLTKRKIDFPAIAVCGCFALYTLISDILVEKWMQFACIEMYVVLLIFGLVWHSCENNESFIKDFERAVQIFLFFIAFVSILFRNDAVLARFSGPLANPSIYALYLGAIWAVLLGSLENHLNHRSSRTTVFLTSIELFVTAVLLLLSQSLTPLVAVFTVTFIWGFRYIARKKGTKTAITIATIIIGLIAVSAICLIWFVRRPEFATDSRLLSKLKAVSLTSFLSGRDYYWKKYLMNMDAFGHFDKPFLWTRTILPHNALIGVAYRYGVPAVVPYIIMMLMGIEKSCRFANTGLRYSAVPLYSIVSFVIMSIADNVERPFIWLPWIACYLMMVPILAMPVDEIEKDDRQELIWKDEA